MRPPGSGVPTAGHDARVQGVQVDGEIDRPGDALEVLHGRLPARRGVQVPGLEHLEARRHPEELVLLLGVAAHPQEGQGPPQFIDPAHDAGVGEFAAVVALPEVGVGVQGHHRQVRVAGLHRLDQGHGDGMFAPQGGR